MTPFTEEQIEWLAENLLLDIKTEDTYSYTGGDSQMYTSYKTITLRLGEVTLGEVSFT